MPRKHAAAARAGRTRLRFECTQCGACCTNRGDYAYVYVTDEEIDAMASDLSMSVARFRRRYTFEDDGGWTQIRFRKDGCAFLDPATKRCAVYRVRPVQCRTFPFWRELVGENGWTGAAKDLCEGIGQGPVHDADEVEKLMREMEEAE